MADTLEQWATEMWTLEISEELDIAEAALDKHTELITDMRSRVDQVIDNGQAIAEVTLWR